MREHLANLHQRRRIVRDGAWIFVRGYLARQPKGDNLLRGARSDVESCSSISILNAWSEKYPHLSRWSVDRLATLGRPSTDLSATEQSSTEQYRAEQSRAEQAGNEHGPAVKPPASTSAGAHTPAASGTGPSAAMREVLATIERCPAFRTSVRLRDEAFWLAEIDANPDIDVLAQTLKAQAWLVAHPRQSKRDVVRYLHNWFTNPLARSSP